MAHGHRRIPVSLGWVDAHRRSGSPTEARHIFRAGGGSNCPTLSRAGDRFADRSVGIHVQPRRRLPALVLPLEAVLLDLLLLGVLAGIRSAADVKAARLGCDISLCLLVLLSLGTAGLIIWRAEARAGDHPYCLVVPRGEPPRRYRAPETLFDLTAWRAQAKEVIGHGFSGPTTATTWEQHAALLISNGDDVEVLNWSYWSMDFRYEPNGWRDRPDRRWTPLNALHFFSGCEPGPHALLPLLSVRRLFVVVPNVHSNYTQAPWIAG